MVKEVQPRRLMNGSVFTGRARVYDLMVRKKIGQSSFPDAKVLLVKTADVQCSPFRFQREPNRKKKRVQGAWNLHIQKSHKLQDTFGVNEKANATPLRCFSMRFEIVVVLNWAPSVSLNMAFSGFFRLLLHLLRKKKA